MGKLRQALDFNDGLFGRSIPISPRGNSALDLERDSWNDCTLSCRRFWRERDHAKPGATQAQRAVYGSQLHLDSCQRSFARSLRGAATPNFMEAWPVREHMRRERLDASIGGFILCELKYLLNVSRN